MDSLRVNSPGGTVLVVEGNAVEGGGVSVEVGGVVVGPEGLLLPTPFEGGPPGVEPTQGIVFTIGHQCIAISCQWQINAMSKANAFVCSKKKQTTPY